MRLAIIGSRSFKNLHVAESVLIAFFPKSTVITEIVSGGAKGADLIGKTLANSHDIKYTEFLPDWHKHGKSAGYIRNKQIVENCDMVLAFHDGLSKGTQHSIDIARTLKKPTLIWYF